MTWHYRDADPHFGLWQAKDMQIHMEDVLSNLPLEILQGNRMVEVRHQVRGEEVEGREREGRLSSVLGDDAGGGSVPLSLGRKGDARV